MIEIIKELDVEVTKQNIFQAIVAKQYDMNTRFLKVTFMDCGNRIDIPYIETAKVVINAERKDGQSDAFEGVINDDGTVTVPLHSWMLQLDGTVICDISVIDTAADNNKKLTTTSFTLIVEKAAYGGEDVTSDPQYDVLVSLLGTCASASEAAQEALDKSNEALKKSSEANSKYDACVEATNNANAVREEIEAGGYIESLKELNQGGKFSFWVGTQAKYDALTEKQPNTLYLISDDLTETEIRQLIAKNAEDIAKNTTAIAENASAIHSNMLGVYNLGKDAYALEIRRNTYFFEPPYNSSGVPFGDVSTQGFYMKLLEKDEKLSDHSVVWVDGVLCTVYFRIDKSCYFITGTGTQDTDTSVENYLNLQHIEITVGSTPEVDEYGRNKYLIAKNNCHSYKISPSGIEVYPKPIQIIRGVY